MSETNAKTTAAKLEDLTAKALKARAENLEKVVVRAPSKAKIRKQLREADPKLKGNALTDKTNEIHAKYQGERDQALKLLTDKKAPITSVWQRGSRSFQLSASLAEVNSAILKEMSSIRRAKGRVTNKAKKAEKAGKSTVRFEKQIAKLNKQLDALKAL